MKITGTIITKDEADNIERCIKSLQSVCDEIIVIDSFSSDNTVELAQSLGAKVIMRKFEGYIEQKNYAIAQAKSAMVLSLDADEELSETLINSIHAVKEANQDFCASKINRKSYYLGRWIRFSGWYPDAKIRLFDKRIARWEGVNPHDQIRLSNGYDAVFIAGDILHYSYNGISDHIDQINSYSTISAQEKYKKGKRCILIVHLVLYPIWIWLRTYIFKLGFLDGYQGLVISTLNAYYRFLKYAKLKALYKLK